MLKEVFQYFFKLGWIAFGGPAAHLAIMREDLVDRKKWLTDQEFLDYMGVTNLIPGPNSTEMTMHCGYHRAGVPGLFVAGWSFIFPAVCLTLGVAFIFEKYGDISWMIPIVAAIKSAVIAFIIGAIVKLGKKAVTSGPLLALGLAVVGASLYGINEILCILAAGVLWTLIQRVIKGGTIGNFGLIPLFGLLLANSDLWRVFLIFLKIGALLFGSGYVLFAYLDGELIQNLGWLDHDALTEAIAIGQLTPGPVLSTATFIGYKLAGVWGAILATLGIFLPSFLYVWILNPLVPKMKNSETLRFFLQGVNVAAVAVMLAVSYYLIKSTVIDWKTGGIALLSFVIYFFVKKVSPLWIILGAGVLGYVLSFV